MRNYKAVIFDLDGTLMDTLPDLHSALCHSLNACGYEGRSLDEVRSFIGEGVKMLVVKAMPDDIKPKQGFTDEFVKECERVGKEFIDFYTVHGEDLTRPYAGIRELLAALNAKGVKCAVVSNKVIEAVKSLVKRNLDGLFCCEKGDGEGIKLKPEPDLLLVALDEMGVSKDDACYVGDGETDIASATKAGMDVISVSYGYRSEEHLIANGARTIARSVKELASLLGVKI